MPNNPREINLKNLTARDKTMLKWLGDNYSPLYDASGKASWDINTNPGTLRISFKEGRLIQYETSKKTKKRWGLIHTAFSSGGGAYVYKVNGVLNSKWIYKDKEGSEKQRLLKVPRDIDAQFGSYLNVLRESIVTPPHLKPTRPVAYYGNADDKEKKQYGLLFKYINGIELLTLIQGMYYPKDNDFPVNYKNLCTEVHFLKIMCALTEGYYQDIYRYGLVHRDIKPENIVVAYDETTNQWSAHFIDYEFACSIFERNRTAKGTPNYMHFKAAEGLIDYKMDLGSLGFIFALMFGDFSIANIEHSDIHAIYNKTKNFTCDQLRSQWGQPFVIQLQMLIKGLVREDNQYDLKDMARLLNQIVGLVNQVDPEADVTPFNFSILDEAIAESDVMMRTCFEILYADNTYALDEDGLNELYQYKHEILKHRGDQEKLQALYNQLVDMRIGRYSQLFSLKGFPASIKVASEEAKLTHDNRWLDSYRSIISYDECLQGLVALSQKADLQYINQELLDFIDESQKMLVQTPSEDILIHLEYLQKVIKDPLYHLYLKYFTRLEYLNQSYPYSIPELDLSVYEVSLDDLSDEHLKALFCSLRELVIAYEQQPLQDYYEKRDELLKSVDIRRFSYFNSDCGQKNKKNEALLQQVETHRKEVLLAARPSERANLAKIFLNELERPSEEKKIEYKCL